MTLAGQILLMLAAIASTLYLFRGTQESIDTSSEIKVTRLSLLSMIIALIGSFTLTSDSMDSSTLLRMLSNLALYAGAPMMTSALLARAMQRSFTMQTWGRYLLALIALFELCRRMDAGTGYSMVLAVVLVAALAVAAFVSKIKSQRASFLSAALLLAISVISWRANTSDLLIYIALSLTLLFASMGMKSKAKQT
jgi:hypothetical protein